MEVSTVLRTGTVVDDSVNYSVVPTVQYYSSTVLVLVRNYLKDYFQHLPYRTYLRIIPKRP